MKVELSLVQLLILFILGSSSIIAQDVSRVIFNENHGLPSREVYSLALDKYGHLWLGTSFGLTKYDGQRFTVIRNPFQKGSSFSKLQMDNSGRIWMHNFVGQLFMAEQDSLNLFTPYHQELSIPYAFFTLGLDNSIFITGKNGIYYGANNTSAIELICEAKNADFIGSHPKWGTIAYRNLNAIIQLSPTDVQFKPIFERADKMNAHLISFFWKDKLVVLEQKTSNVHVFEDLNTKSDLQVKQIEVLLTTIKGQINHIRVLDDNWWILSSNGVFIVDFSAEPKLVHLLKTINCSDAIKDLDGRYWVSSLTDGLILLSNLNMYSYDDKNSTLLDSRISSLSRDNHFLYLGTWNGAIQKIAFNNPTQVDLVHRGTLRISYMNFSNDQYLGAFVTGSSTHIVNKMNGQITTSIIGSVKSLSWLNHESLVYASTGSMGIIGKPSINTSWLLAHPVVRTASYESKTHYMFGDDAYVSTLFLPEKKELWIGSRSKLSVLTEDDVHVINHPITGEAIYASTIMTREDSTIWVGSLSAELFAFKNRSAVFYLSGEETKGISIRSIADDGTYLWISTSNGLLRLTPPTFTSTNGLLKETELIFLSELDGLISNEITSLIAYEKQLYLGSFNGLQTFEVDKMNQFIALPSIQLINSNIPFDESASPYKLAYYDNYFEAEIAGTSLKSGHSLTLKYRLKGHQTDWNFTHSNRQKVQFFDLRPGKYEFEAYSLNKALKPSEQTLLLRFEILPPFWTAWWFITTLSFLFGGGIFALTWIRFRQREYKLIQIQEKERLEDQLRISRLSAIQAQMNPHFIFNALNSIQHYIFEKDLASSNFFIGRFADLMRAIMVHSKLESVSIHDEIQLLKSYLDLEQMRLDHRFTYELKIDEQLDPYLSSIPAMIIQPFIENCIKHGFNGLKQRQGHIDLNFELKENGLVEVSITDNGIGRQSAAILKTSSNTSFSAKASETRIALLNKRYMDRLGISIEDLFDSNGKASGTKVLITLPLLND